MTDTEHLKQKFWTAHADSPFLFLQLDAHQHAALPADPRPRRSPARATTFSPASPGRWPKKPTRAGARRNGARRSRPGSPAARTIPTC